MEELESATVGTQLKIHTKRQSNKR